MQQPKAIRRQYSQEFNTKLSGSGTKGILPPVPMLKCAVCLIDHWNETVPAVEQPTCAAFGFNAPAARAPQAVLIAVPPNAEGQLDDLILAGIVAETRELAHARMAGPDELGRYAGTIPSLMFPAIGDTGIDLFPPTEG